MPHIHLETTADLHENADVPDILAELVQVLSGFETMKPSAIKAYHTLRSVWSMGEGGAEGFAHVTVAILAGRPMELKERIATGIHEALLRSLAYSVENDNVSITVEMREMERETYRSN